MEKIINTLLGMFHLRLVKVQHGVPDGCVKFISGFRTWDEALNASEGYDDPSILEKVRSAALKVKVGEASYERDSVLFDQVQYSWPVLAALLWVCSRNDGVLSVLDFGGSLGTSYYQNKRFLNALPYDVHWAVVEQAHFVEMGKRDMEGENLKFYHSIDEAVATCAPNVAVLSSVLQYIECPYDVLSTVLSLNLEVVVIDIFPLIEGEDDLISVEHVPESIYKASYPAWFFNKDKFSQYIQSKGYNVFEEFPSFVGDSLYIDGVPAAHDTGFILTKQK